jgi:hypothetical protein
VPNTYVIFFFSLHHFKDALIFLLAFLGFEIDRRTTIWPISIYHDAQSRSRNGASIHFQARSLLNCMFRSSHSG